MAAEAGRDPDTMEVSLYGAPTDAARLEALRDAGLTRAVFLALPLPAEKLLPVLDDLATVARQIG
jgi:hypothetical protein